MTVRAAFALALALLLTLARAVSAQTPPPPPPPPPPLAEEGEVFTVVERMPELIGGLASIQPVYPEMERRAGVEGRVFLQFIINEDGSVSDVSVSRGVSPGLDAAAVEAIRRARFTPGTQRGRPVKVRFSLPVNFRLDDGGPPPAYARPPTPVPADPLPATAALPFPLAAYCASLRDAERALAEEGERHALSAPERPDLAPRDVALAVRDALDPQAGGPAVTLPAGTPLRVYRLDLDAQRRPRVLVGVSGGPARGSMGFVAPAVLGGAAADSAAAYTRRRDAHAERGGLLPRLLASATAERASCERTVVLAHDLDVDTLTIIPVRVAGYASVRRFGGETLRSARPVEYAVGTMGEDLVVLNDTGYEFAALAASDAVLSPAVRRALDDATPGFNAHMDRGFARTQATLDSLENAYYARYPDVLITELQAVGDAYFTGARINFKNLRRGAAIRYIRFTLRPYNRVGDFVSGRQGGGAETVTAIGPAEPSVSAVYTWENGNLWPTEVIDCVRITAVTVEYMDRSTRSWTSNVGSLFEDPAWNRCN